MAAIVSVYPCDPPKRFVVFRIFGLNIMLKDESRKIEYRIKADSMTELSHIALYSDEQWEVWLGAKGARVE